MRVSFIPPADEFSSNAMFEGRRVGSSAHGPNNHWFDCYVALHELAREAGICMATSDVLPVGAADVVVFMTQPSPAEIAAFKARHPHVKTVLILLETSLGALYCFNPANHAEFDLVLTYREGLVDRRKYFPLRPHAYFLERRREGLAFAERKTGCLVGANRKMRYRTGLFLGRAGWRLSVRERMEYAFCPGELITSRTALARACVQHPSGQFDVFGEGWDSDPVTRGRTLPPPKLPTLDYIGQYKFYFAFENHGARESLISERIWDALWGGAVPVYRGNPDIHRVVPTDCFIDAGSFAGPKALLDHLHEMPQARWEEYRAAAEGFLQGEGVKPFLPEACAQELLEPFIQLKQMRSA